MGLFTGEQLLQSFTDKFIEHCHFLGIPYLRRGYDVIVFFDDERHLRYSLKEVCEPCEHDEKIHDEYVNQREEIKE